MTKPDTQSETQQTSEPEGKPSAETIAAAALAIAGVLAAFGLYARAATPFYQKYWVDDAAISFTFARNIAQGFGSVAYPGGERVEGFSNPTWVALLATLQKAGVDPFDGSQYLALLFSGGVLLTFGLFALLPSADGRRPWALGLAALFVAGHAGFAIWNHSGLENSLYSLLLVASLLLATREAADEKLFPFSALTLAALAITRPEGPMHAVIAGGYLLLADLTIRGRPARRLALWAVMFVGVFALYQLWHYVYFAWPFANTYYAKVLPSLGARVFSFHSAGWNYIFTFFSTYEFWPLPFLCLPAFFGKRWREALYFAATAAYLAFFTLVSNGDWMKSWRFLSSFPIPLGLLIGLAALNVGDWIKRLAARGGDPRVAVVAGLAVAALYVAIPAGLAVGASQKVLDGFAEKHEVSAKGIARRAKWWSDIAHKLAREPHDLTMCDMDMGGTSFNWPGKIMDIGYLLDVPMARRRYTPEWPRMMDEYFFAERRPDFIHIRRGWGKVTTVPDNPKFPSQYLTLPDDRHFSEPPNGNYVRRDLFEVDAPPRPDWPPIAFVAGLVLRGAEIPAALDPGRKTPIFLTWRREGGEEGDCRLSVGLARPGETPELHGHAALMGWAGTAEWPRDRFIREAVVLEAPKEDGVYDVYVGVDPPHGAREVVKLPETVEVGRAAAKRLAESLLAEARAAANGGPAELEAAKAKWQRAEQILGEQSVAADVRGIEKLRLADYVRLAAAAFDGGDAVAAANLLAPAWRIDARDPALRKLGWRISDKLRQAGRQEQERRAYDDAYRDFSAACRAQPQDAWARRYAEEVRMLRSTTGLASRASSESAAE
jgi:hypothetical protein